MYSISDLQKLVQMLSFLGVSPGSGAPAHSVVFGGGTYALPGASGSLLASNGASADPSFQTLAALGIQTSLGYTPAHAGANSDITSLSGLSTPLSITQGGTGAATAALARTALGAAASGANTDITSLASPAIGSATATTQARGTNNTDVATCAYVLRQAPFVNILDYGGDPTGVSDNSAAFASALAACISGRVCIYFPPGKYVFTSTITYTFPSAGATIVITGAGPDTTELCWPSAGIGMQFNYLGAFNGVHVRDMALTCGTTNTATAIFLNQTATSIPNPAVSNLNDFTNLTFRGSDGYVVNFVWACAINVFAVSMVNYTNCAVFGNSTSTQGLGMDLHGLNSGCQGVVSNFVNCVFTNSNIDIVYGDWYEGVAVSQCNFGGQIGIQAPIGAGGQDQLTVSNCQFNCAIAAMQLNQPVPGLIVSNNLIILQFTNARGITSDNYCNFQIVGNQFGGPSVGLSTLGIYLKNATGGSIAGGVITGNIFVTLTNAITLDTTSTKVNVQSNAYLGCSVGVTNTGAGNTIGGGSP